MKSKRISSSSFPIFHLKKQGWCFACRNDIMYYQGTILVKITEDWVKGENTKDFSVGRFKASLTLTCSSISRITVVAWDTSFTVFATRQIFTLLTDAFIDTLTVPVTLAGCREEERMSICAHSGSLDPQSSGFCRAWMKPFHTPPKEVLAVLLETHELIKVCAGNMIFKAIHGKLNSKTLCAYWKDRMGSSRWDRFTKGTGEERL